MNIPDGHPYIDIYCLGCGAIHRVPQYCGNRFCPLCSAGKLHRIRTRLNSFYDILPTPPGQTMKMVTLTLKDRPVLHDMVSDLMKYWKYLQRRKWWRNLVSGGAYVLEVTRPSQNWHAHLHILVHAKYIDVYELSPIWHKITGDSFIVYVNDVYSNPTWYLTKYLTKAHGDPNLKRHLQFMSDALKNRRMFQPFGAWFKAMPKYLKKPVLCPFCNGHEYISEFDIKKEFRSINEARK